MIILYITTNVAAPGLIMLSEPEQFKNETVMAFNSNMDSWRKLWTINLNVSPQVPIMSNRRSALLILSYNTFYNVSVPANICGLSLSSPTTSLHYGESLYCSKINILLMLLSMQLNVFLH